MNKMRQIPISNAGYQKGALTIISAVMILFLMTVAMLYSARNALFDQRAAANELRNKTAFARAESAANAVSEYLVVETSKVIGSGTGDFFDPSNPVWTSCASATASVCASNLDVDSSQLANTWYIEDLGASNTAVKNAIDLAVGNQGAATVSMAFQYVSEGVVDSSPTAESQAVFMIYAYGFSDCGTAGDPTTCQGSAEIAVPLATYSLISAPPDVPFTSKSFVDSNGGWTVVANPNAGGVGVPVSMWMNARATDGNDQGIDFDPGAGTWQTCEFDEWYETASKPDFAACPGSVDSSGIKGNGNHGCGCSTEEILSGSVKGRLAPNLDLLVDPAFPTDLFLTYFGVPKTQYSVIKNSAKILTDCSTLDNTSGGVYWITGACSIKGQVGHYDNPVVLIGAGGININGGLVYGIVYCSDAEGGNPEIGLGGNGVVYGAIVVDCALGNTNGTFDLVFNADIIGRANGVGGVGAANGGWRDFDIPAHPLATN